MAIGSFFQRKLCVAILLFPCTQALASTLIQVLDVNDRPVSDAVVFLDNGTSTSIKSATAEIQQKDKKFIPFVSVVQTGTAISFPNNDTVRHHVYSFSPAKSFQIKLYAGKPEAPVVFDKPGTIVLGCNIHDQMIAFVQVVDTPHFAKTDASGLANIPNVPAGKYVLKTWYYKQVTGSPPLEQAINVTDSDHRFIVKLKIGS